MKTIIELSACAQAYYEGLRAKSLAMGWEKLVATDGERCMFVHSDYVPREGEAVFFLSTRNRETLCELRAFRESESLLAWRRMEGLTWGIKHECGVVMTFQEGRFNETQKVEVPDAFRRKSPLEAARVMREIGDFAGGDDFRFVSVCNVDARCAVWHAMGPVLLADAAKALSWAIAPDDEDDIIEVAEMYFNGDSPLDRAVQSLTDCECIELVRMVDAYWLSPYDLAKWVTDYALWVEDYEESLK